MIIGRTAMQDTIPTESRWATCSKHDEEFVEVYLPRLQMWHSSHDCPGCELEAKTGQRQPRRGQTVEEFRLQLACIPARFEGKTLNPVAMTKAVNHEGEPAYNPETRQEVEKFIIRTFRPVRLMGWKITDVRLQMSILDSTVQFTRIDAQHQFPFGLRRLAY